MRGFGLIGLVLVLAIMGWALKKQLAVVAPRPMAPAAAPASEGGAAAVRAQSQQIQQHIKQQLDAVISQPRPGLDDH